MNLLQTLGDVIPAPSYIRMPSLGVDISDSSLKYIHLTPDTKSGATLELSKWGNVVIPDGTLQKGKVQDEKKLVQCLKEMKEKTRIDSVRVSLPEEHAYLFDTEVKKGTPFKEIRGLLEFRLEENVPLSPRDALFDYEIIENESRKDMLSVSVTAYAKDTIISYHRACIEAGLIPLSFEVEAQAIARATIPKHDTRTHFIVDFGRARTGIGIVHKNMLVYTSTIDLGGDNLSQMLRKQLGDVEESELTKIKNTQGLVRAGDGRVYDALVPTMSAISDEIKTRIQYWNTQGKGVEDKSIESIILCGGSVNMKGLPGYFSDVLGIPAHRANVWQNAFSLEDTIPPIDKQHSYGYATAIGLALASFS